MALRSNVGKLKDLLVKVREGNHETVHYFVTNDELDSFKAANAALF